MILDVVHGVVCGFAGVQAFGLGVYAKLALDNIQNSPQVSVVAVENRVFHAVLFKLGLDNTVIEKDTVSPEINSVIAVILELDKPVMEEFEHVLLSTLAPGDERLQRLGVCIQPPLERRAVNSELLASDVANPIEGIQNSRIKSMVSVWRMYDIGKY